MNQDSRRKLKQVYHLFQFIEPLLKTLKQDREGITLVDHGAGKSYLGFILYDLFFKHLQDESHLYGIETREELVKSATDLARRLEFPRSEERRVGKECVSTCRSRWSPCP